MIWFHLFYLFVVWWNLHSSLHDIWHSQFISIRQTLVLSGWSVEKGIQCSILVPIQWGFVFFFEDVFHMKAAPEWVYLLYWDRALSVGGMVSIVLRPVVNMISWCLFISLCLIVLQKRLIKKSCMILIVGDWMDRHNCKVVNAPVLYI